MHKFLLFFVFFLIAGLFLGCSSKKRKVPPAPSAKVIISKGTVVTGIQGSEERIPVLVRSKIPNRNVVTTFDESHLELVIDSDTIIVDQNTRLVIDLTTGEKGRDLHFYLSYGKIFFLLNRGTAWEDEWKVTTPSALMQGKSNGFVVEVGRQDKVTDVSVLDGQIVVLNKEEEGFTNVDAAMGCRIARESPPDRPLDIIPWYYNGLETWVGTGRLGRYKAVTDTVSDTVTGTVTGTVTDTVNISITDTVTD
jgi:hypothetical protein